jgi:hypothetical protein
MKIDRLLKNPASGFDELSPTWVKLQKAPQ